MNERQRAILESARAVLGTPFHHQGRLPHVGLDCIGVLTTVAKDLDLPHNDNTTYKRVPKHSVLSKYLALSGCEPIALEDADTGDILTFWFQVEDRENHVAVLGETGEGDERRHTLIHSFASSGGVVEHGFDDYWKARVMNAWRFPEEKS